MDAAAAVAELLGVSPPPPPPPPVSTCEPTDPVVVDPAFDATQLLGTTSPLPSEDALDVLEGRVVEVGPDLEFRITVTDLTDQPPSLSFGEYFDFVFKLNGVEYYATAQRDQLSGEFYELGRFAPTRTHVADLTGSFDNETDTITIRVPPTAFDGPQLLRTRRRADRHQHHFTPGTHPDRARRRLRTGPVPVHGRLRVDPAPTGRRAADPAGAGARTARSRPASRTRGRESRRPASTRCSSARCR